MLANYLQKAVLAAILPLMMVGNPFVTGLYPRHVGPYNTMDVSISDSIGARYMNRETRRRLRKLGVTG